MNFFFPRLREVKKKKSQYKFFEFGILLIYIYIILLEDSFKVLNLLLVS